MAKDLIDIRDNTIKLYTSNIYQPDQDTEFAVLAKTYVECVKIDSLNNLAGGVLSDICKEVLDMDGTE